MQGDTGTPPRTVFYKKEVYSMFFSKKKSSAPAAESAAPAADPDDLRVGIYNAVDRYLSVKGYKYDRSPSDRTLILFLKSDSTGSNGVLFNCRSNSLLIAIMSDFTRRHCSPDDVSLLCAYANSKLLNGTYYPDHDDEHVFIDVCQIVTDISQLDDDNMDYLLDLVKSLCDNKYTVALKDVCEGRKDVGTALDELAASNQ